MARVSHDARVPARRQALRLGDWTVGEMLDLSDYWVARLGLPRDPPPLPPQDAPPPRAD